MKIEFDENVYYPLGGASYIFHDNLIKYLRSKIKKKKVVISFGAQPNSSPHFGTISVLALAFATAEKLTAEYPEIETSVLFEVVDTAPSEQVVINGLKYQKNLRKTGQLLKYMPQFVEILDYFSKKTNVSYQIRYQKEFNKQKEIAGIVKHIVKNRDKVSKFLDPKFETLKMRASCPICGLSDKNSINNRYEGDNIMFCTCPEHGEFKIDIDSNSESLEYNTPVRNLIRAEVYGEINASDEYDYEIIRVTGADYAGFYQEELLYKVAGILDFAVKNFPIILYCPLITDWSGAKLSKTLYVKHGAYKDLPKYLINYENLMEEKGLKGLDTLFEICKNWVDEPYKLFRTYSIYYFMKIFEEM